MVLTLTYEESGNTHYEHFDAIATALTNYVALLQKPTVTYICLTDQHSVVALFNRNVLLHYDDHTIAYNIIS